MEMLIERGAGLDVHKATVVATVRVPGEAGTRRVVIANERSGTEFNGPQGHRGTEKAFGSCWHWLLL